MEISQGNSLCNYLNQAKMSFFSFTKSENRKVEQLLPLGGRWYQWEGGGQEERAWEGEYGTNSVYTCM
jgi:hypothetical protein